MLNDVGLTNMLASFEQTLRLQRATVTSIQLKVCLNEANALVQHHPTLFDATCCHRLNTRLEDVG